MAHISSIVYTPAGIERKPADWYARVPLERAMLIEGRGIDGDVKGTGGSRQLNIMRAETLIELAADGRKVGPGEMGEQLVIAGIEPRQLEKGTRLRIGNEAVIQVGIARTGCDRFVHIQRTTKQSVASRLGVLSRVIVGGQISVGDQVVIVK